MDLIDKKKAEQIMAEQKRVPAGFTSEDAKKHMNEVETEEVYKIDPKDLETSDDPEAKAPAEVRTELPATPLMHENVPSKLLATGKNIRSNITNEDIYVDVTAFEEASFIDAIMADDDKPFTLSIPIIKGRLSFSFRSRTPAENMLVMQWCSRLEGKTSFETVAKLQQAYAAVQLTDINGVPVAPLVIKTFEDLDKAIEARISNMNASKFDFLVDALKVFDRKEQILKTKLVNKDFTNPPD